MHAAPSNVAACRPRRTTQPICSHLAADSSRIRPGGSAVTHSARECWCVARGTPAAQQAQQPDVSSGQCASSERAGIDCRPCRMCTTTGERGRLRMQRGCMCVMSVDRLPASASLAAAWRGSAWCHSLIRPVRKCILLHTLRGWTDHSTAHSAQHALGVSRTPDRSHGAHEFEICTIYGGAMSAPCNFGMTEYP